MRQIITVLFGVVALSVAGVPGSLAADMPTKARVAAPVMGPSWTACYIGGNGGGGWARESRTWTSVNGTPLNPAFPLGSPTASGLAVGGQIGCDYQFNSNWVVGVRGMWDWSSLKGSSFIPLPNIGNFRDQFSNTKVESFGTVVGRVGYLVSPTVMLYGLGGVAWSKNHYTVTTASAGGDGVLFSGDQARIGYDVGAGVSWMFAPNWALWVEYDHMGFGTKTASLTGALGLAGFTVDVDVKQNIDKVLLGVD
jgi:outer membrane immunogenic protein